jgi:hypothetical protein
MELGMPVELGMILGMLMRVAHGEADSMRRIDEVGMQCGLWIQATRIQVAVALDLLTILSKVAHFRTALMGLDEASEVREAVHIGKVEDHVVSAEVEVVLVALRERGFADQ